MRTVGVLLAAGASRRFGSEDKLLAPYRHKPLVAAAAQTLSGAGCDACAAIVSSCEVAGVLPEEMTPLLIRGGLPMGASFHRALAHARRLRADKLLICLGDMPNVSSEHLRRLIAQNRSSFSAFGLVRMPPVLIVAADYTDASRAARGDCGARELLTRLDREAMIALSQREALDIDCAEDLIGPA